MHRSSSPATESAALTSSPGSPGWTKPMQPAPPSGGAIATICVSDHETTVASEHPPPRLANAHLTPVGCGAPKPLPLIVTCCPAQPTAGLIDVIPVGHA